jgi:hypothetical protein
MTAPEPLSQKCGGTLASEHAGPPAGRHEPRVEPVVANRESLRRRRLTLACWPTQHTTDPVGIEPAALPASGR